MKSRPFRLAYLVSHPIQYQAPMLRRIASEPDIDLTVFFLSDFSLHDYQDKGFGTSVKWDVPLLDGYRYQFLPAWGGADRISAVRPFSHSFAGRLRAGKFDALWMHGYAHPVNIRAMILARRMGIKVLLRAESQLGSAVRNDSSRAVKERVIRWLFARADGFLAIGSLNRDYYQHYGVPSHKIFSMPYAVDNAHFRSKADEARAHREALRTEVGLESGRPIILFASKFEERKRAADLLEAYALLLKGLQASPTVSGKLPYLVFVGSGEQGNSLEARALEIDPNGANVKFLGFKNQTELPAFFDLCDVFVLVSDREPWGLIVNEAMNAGKPIIVSDQVGASPDLVRDGENGYVIKVGDVTALSQRLEYLVRHPDVAERMGEASRLRIEGWGFEQDVQGLKEALDAVVA